MQEVADLEADSRAMDRRIIVDRSIIAHIGPYCKRYRFRLYNLQKLSIKATLYNITLITSYTLTCWLPHGGY